MESWVGWKFWDGQDTTRFLHGKCAPSIPSKQIGLLAHLRCEGGCQEGVSTEDPGAKSGLRVDGTIRKFGGLCGLYSKTSPGVPVPSNLSLHGLHLVVGEQDSSISTDWTCGDRLEVGQGLQRLDAEGSDSLLCIPREEVVGEIQQTRVDGTGWTSKEPPFLRDPAE